MPLLSIVVPTHERARYAIPTITSLLETTGDEVEIVVTDTSSVDTITQAVSGLAGRQRVTVLRPGQGLSVVDNFNAGLSCARGDYLLFLGDDDFVAPSIVELLRWAAAEEVDALKLSFPALYYWPDFLHKRRHDFYAGSLHIQAFSGRVYAHDARATLRDAAIDLGGGVGEMPRAYAGIVSRRLVERIVARYGALFGGVSPDIYSAALIATEARHCVYVDYPVVIPGSSGASTAGQSAQGRHVGDLRDNAHIAAFKSLAWNPIVPEFYSVPTVWGYSLLEALKRVEPAVASRPGRLHARCLFYHRRYRAHALHSIRAWAREVGNGQALIGLLSGCAAELGWVARKVRSLLMQRLAPARTTVLRELPDSIVAARRAGAWLRDAAPPLRLPDAGARQTAAAD